MIFRELRQSDIDYVKDHSISRGVLNKQPERTDFLYTLEHEGEILGIGGIRLIIPTTAWCWIDLTVHATEHIITVYRVVREWMDVLIEQHHIKRLQAYIEPDFPEAIRMIQRLGFEWESNMRNFLPNGDAYMYTKLYGVSDGTVDKQE